MVKIMTLSVTQFPIREPVYLCWQITLLGNLTTPKLGLMYDGTQTRK
jgi:hypothetical protein